MNTTENIIEEMGLSKTEAKIYLAALGSAGIGAHDIARQTGIKRPTVYHALESLLQKGFAAKKDVGTRRVFTMASPESIKRLLDEKISRLEQQKSHLDTLMPIYEKIKSQKTRAFNVEQYDGVEGIKLVVEEALYCRSRRWDIIAPQKNFFSEFDKEYAHYYTETRKRRNIKSRSLWEGSPEAPQTPSAKIITPDIIAERNPRFLPHVMHGTFKEVMILFDDNVAIISSYEILSAILIESKETHDMMSAMFEGLWSVSQPPILPRVA